MNRWLCSLFLAATAAAGAQEPSVTAFVNVHVVPMDSERVLRRQTVLVRGDTIAAVGDFYDIDVPAGALRVEGGGSAYLLPGLTDAHTHVEFPEDAALYVANGVTTVFQMGGDRKLPIRLIRAGIADGSVVAPQIFFGLKLDGPESPFDGWPVNTPAEAEAAVVMAKANDYDFIKLYNGLSVEVFDAIVAAARQGGLPVVGHAVRSVGLPQGLFKGQVMVAHAEEFFYTVFANKTDEAAIPEVVEQTHASNAYVAPNLSTFETIAAQWGKPAAVEEYLRDPRVRYMSLQARVSWITRDYVRRSGDISDTLPFLRAFTKALADRGVPLLTSTDSPVIPGLVPGYSLHEDLRTLREAGLTQYQALSAATRTPGEFVARHIRGAAPFGVVAAGARADLLLVSTDPLQSLDALRKPLGVMVGGRWRTAAELAAVLEANKAAVESIERRLPR